MNTLLLPTVMNTLLLPTVMNSLCRACVWCGAVSAHAAIEHYAGLVNYDARTFVDKNKDVILLDLIELWESSSVPLMKQIYSDESQISSPSTGKSQTQSQALHFRSQVRMFVCASACAASHACHVSCEQRSCSI